jgi:hypothetical protein
MAPLFSKKFKIIIMKIFILATALSLGFSASVSAQHIDSNDSKATRKVKTAEKDVKKGYKHTKHDVKTGYKNTKSDVKAGVEGAKENKENR